MPTKPPPWGRKTTHTPKANRNPMPQRVIYTTNRTPASSSLADFKVKQASRIKRSIFATIVVIQRATTDTKFSKGTWHQKMNNRRDDKATHQKYNLSLCLQSLHPGAESPHTPKANRNPMPQRVIHPTNRTPASSSLANFKVQQASRIKRSIFATLVVIQRATTDKIQ